MIKSIPPVFCSVLFLIGCDAPEAEPVEFRPGGSSGSSGGVYLNTNAIGVNAFSELDLGGTLHHGVRLDEVRIKGLLGLTFPLEAVWSEAGELVGVAGGVEYRGSQFVGSTWNLSFDVNGVFKPETMWVESLTTQGGFRYTFKYSDALLSQHYVCGDAPGDPRTAVALPDISVDAATGVVTQRSDTLYLACTTGAVAKAVDWGYAPWDHGLDVFEAAIRVVRADYCGTGESWTAPGASLQIADVWGVNAFGDGTLGTEAIWDDGGAVCLDEERLALFDGEVKCGGTKVPTCGNGATLNNVSGGLFWTKRAPY